VSVPAHVPSGCRGLAKLHEQKWTARRPQFLSSLRQHAFPILGDLPLPAIDTPAVLRVIQPIWTSKTETASRVRQRIEAVLDWATVSGHRPKGENPARWKGHLAMILPSPGAIAKVQHHPALPWSEIGAFMGELRSREGVTARALEFAILTAARTNEVIGARWSEVDLDAATWTIPAARMKMTREHRVPLAAGTRPIAWAVYRGEQRFHIHRPAGGAWVGRPGIGRSAGAHGAHRHHGPRLPEHISRLGR
jgi:integrase